jgi:hypothetical protein
LVGAPYLCLTLFLFLSLSFSLSLSFFLVLLLSSNRLHITAYASIYNLIVEI